MNSVFSKMSGAGNTFWISDYTQFSSLPTKEQALQWTQELCNGDNPADGLVVLLPDEEVELSWIFLNRDGSDAEMCGNAARCVGRYATEKKLVSSNSFRFRSTAGLIGAEVPSQDEVRVEMTALKQEDYNQTMDHQGTTLNYSFIDSGVPHVVIKVDKLNPLKQHFDLCKSLRAPGLFPPRGANITLIEAISETQLASASFERGVEDFTQACGTGAVAAAVVGKSLNPGVTLLEIQVPGGLLKVDLSAEKPILIGPAVFLDETTVETP